MHAHGTIGQASEVDTSPLTLQGPTLLSLSSSLARYKTWTSVDSAAVLNLLPASAAKRENSIAVMSQLTQQSWSSGTGMASPQLHSITNLAEIHDAADEFGMWLI